MIRKSHRMTGFEKQRANAELWAYAQAAKRLGEIPPYLFYWRFALLGRRWRVMGDRVSDWHWFDKCIDVFVEGTVYRFWGARFMLKIRVSPL